MLIEILDCSQYTLNQRINEFEQDHKIINIAYLFKAPSNIISIIEYTEKKKAWWRLYEMLYPEETKFYLAVPARSGENNKLEQQKEEADVFIL